MELAGEGVRGTPDLLRQLDDRELLRSLRGLIQRDDRLEAELLAYLAEVDRRELHLVEGYPSLHAYCVVELHFSDAVAYQRIQAARAARAFPIVLEHVGSGEIHLTALRLLAPHLTAENHLDLLRRTRHRSKREIEELVADLAPRPSVPSLTRKLPAPRTPPVREPAGLLAPAAALRPPGGEPRRPPDPQPLGGERFKVQFTADRGFCDKLAALQALLRHQIPSGDLSLIFGRAVDLLLEETRRRKFALTDRPRAADAQGGQPSRHIPNAIRREVAERDGERCSFVGPDGRRCTSRAFLEYDHLDPWARHGRHEAPRIRLLCRAHNRQAAARTYGAAKMDRFRQARAASEAPDPPREPSSREPSSTS